MSVSGKLSNKIANMGIVCAVLIVFIHLPRWFGGIGERMLWGFFAYGVGKIAVPFFFAASGYFLAVHFDGELWYGREVKKRIRSLVIPLVVWCVLWWAWNVVIVLVANLVAHRELLSLSACGWGWETWTRVFAVHPFRQPYLPVLWFVRVLFLLVLASPILRWFANPIGVTVLWLLNGLTFPDYGIACTPSVFTVAEGLCSFFAMTWFCLGMMLRVKGTNLIVNCNWKVGACCGLVGFCMLAFRGMPYVSYCSRVLTWLCIPFVLIGVWCICPTRQWPKWLTRAAFPVYLLHMFAISTIHFAIKRSGFPFVDSAWLSGLEYACVGMLAVVISIAASTVLRNFFPRLAIVLFGGR